MFLLFSILNFGAPLPWVGNPPEIYGKYLRKINIFISKIIIIIYLFYLFNIDINDDFVLNKKIY